MNNEFYESFEEGLGWRNKRRRSDRGEHPQNGDFEIRGRKNRSGSRQQRRELRRRKELQDY